MFSFVVNIFLLKKSFHLVIKKGKNAVFTTKNKIYIEQKYARQRPKKRKGEGVSGEGVDA